MGPPAQHPKGVCPEVLGRGTASELGFHPLKVAGWRSPAVPRHMGPPWPIHVIRAGEPGRGRVTGRERSQPDRSLGLLRPNLAFAASFSHQMALTPNVLTVRPLKRPASPLGRGTSSVWALGSLLQGFPFHANALLSWGSLSV